MKVKTVFKKNKTFLLILKYLILSRALFFLLSFLTIKLLSFKPTFPYWQSDLVYFGPRALWSWASFDGAHYLKMAVEGYTADFTQAFFPFYPLLIRLAGFLFNNLLISGLIISNISFVLFIFFLYKELKLNFSRKTALQVIRLYMFFPTSFFFNSVYTESLFMLFSVLGFYLLSKKKYFWSFLTGGVASGIRLIGVFLSLGFFAGWFKSFEKLDLKKIFKGFTLLKVFVYGFISLSGFLAYLLFLNFKFGTPFAFLNAMSLWQKQKFVFFLQTFFRYFKILLDFSLPLEIYLVALFEVMTAFLFSFLLIKSFKKIKPSYFVYSFFAFFLPLSSGTFSSLPRYVLALFPLFVVLSSIIKRHKVFKLFYWLFNFIFLILSMVFFTQGIFVA
jgi:hypothetical protein